MIPTPIRSGVPYLQPVGSVMSLFRNYQGKHAIDIDYSGAIDAVGSATGNDIYLHVANTDMHYAQDITLDLGGKKIKCAEISYIAQKPEVEITPSNVDVFKPKTESFVGNKITLAPAAVAAIKITLE